jgi:hypothetical protein
MRGRFHLSRANAANLSTFETGRALAGYVR